MIIITMNGRVNQGILHLESPISLPEEIPDGNHEITIAIGSSKVSPPVTEWPPNFFAETYGSLADDPIERPDQGELEERDWIE